MPRTGGTLSLRPEKAVLSDTNEIDHGAVQNSADVTLLSCCLIAFSYIRMKFLHIPQKYPYQAIYFDEKLQYPLYRFYSPLPARFCNQRAGSVIKKMLVICVG